MLQKWQADCVSNRQMVCIGFVGFALTALLVQFGMCLSEALVGADCNEFSCCGRCRTQLYWYFSGGSHGAIPMQTSSVNFFRVVPDRKLLFCDIAKNANQAFSDLLCSLMRASEQPAWKRSLAAQLRTWDDFEQGCTWISTNPASVGLSEADTWAAFDHQLPGWTSAVFLRDPLERFLSGYRSKCEPGHDPDRHVCGYVFGSNDAPFEQAVRVINATDGDLKRGTAEDHFRLQSAFCDGAVGEGRFDVYYLLDRATSREDVADMLKRVGVDAPSAATAAFDYHFPSKTPSPPSAVLPMARESLAWTSTQSGSAPAWPSSQTSGDAKIHAAGTVSASAARSTRKHIYGGGEHVTNSGDASSRMKYYSDPSLVAAVLRHCTLCAKCLATPKSPIAMQ